MAPQPPPSKPPKHRFQRKGFSYERLIRFFFASNAGLTIVIILLIIVFLMKEGLGFFPGYRRELEIYRIAGLEFVDISRGNLVAHEQLASVLNRAYYAEINGKCAREMKRAQEAAALYNAFSDRVGPLRDLVLNNPEAQNGGGTGMLEVLRANYEKARSQAVHELPRTPHLTEQERAQLIESLAQRPVDAQEDPPLVAQLNAQYAAAQKLHSEPLADFRTTIDTFESNSMDLGSAIMEMTESVTAIKEQLQNADILEKDRKTLLAAASRAKDPTERAKLIADAEAALAEKPDIETPMISLMERKPQCVELHEQLAKSSAGVLGQLPASLSTPEAQRLLGAARAGWPVYLQGLADASGRIQAWNHKQPVPLSASFASFLTGKHWITGGEWQDFYGILPLAAGSALISVVALLIAIPVGIGAAIYVNQFASQREQMLIKPVIEFTQAIPSVVLGFIGILVFGTLLREISTLDALSWVPGFPLEERLNIFTAGCLLALMSIPTIFSLAEDALNNVPVAYAEASEALGASHIQTAFRVIIPGAFSGILAAVLLGFGRVIGETMVVLLVAGNRIQIPDFSAGLGVFFQPSHTLTGIIAQELGEVPLGSVHYRALFVVGMLLFVIVLGINATAHHFVHKVKK